MPGDIPDFLEKHLTVANHFWSHLESLQRGVRERLYYNTRICLWLWFSGQCDENNVFVFFLQ